jgi:hypothetical protein
MNQRIGRVLEAKYRSKVFAGGSVVAAVGIVALPILFLDRAGCNPVSDMPAHFMAR